MSGDRPVARSADLLPGEIGDELLVYDERDHRAHRLNRTAALVWRSSDGTRTVADLVAVLREQLGEFVDEDLVRVTLDRLDDNGLLASGYTGREPAAEQVSRRRFMRRASAAGAAAIALPVVQSVVVPTAAAASTPPPTPPPTTLDPPG
jgi:Coenzyme PQQ synthesis protein D (PqqD)